MAYTFLKQHIEYKSCIYSQKHVYDNQYLKYTEYGSQCLSVLLHLLWFNWKTFVQKTKKTILVI